MHIQYTSRFSGLERTFLHQIPNSLYFSVSSATTRGSLRCILATLYAIMLYAIKSKFLCLSEKPKTLPSAFSSLAAYER